MNDKGLNLHATCVALAGKGILILGPSGSGKSSLALGLIALGAKLVADDRTLIDLRDSELVASCPEAIKGMIEARNVAIVTLPHVASVVVALTIDLSQVETERLPSKHSYTLLGVTLPCLRKVDAPYFPAAIHAYMHNTDKEQR